MLRVMVVAFGILTLAADYRPAANERQSRLAVALLALNPIFLFTASTTVVEPMLTALLTGAGLAATRPRWKLAATLAVLACATSTKAWRFIGAGPGLWLADQLVLLLPKRRTVTSPQAGRASVGKSVLARPIAAV